MLTVFPTWLRTLFWLTQIHEVYGEHDMRGRNTWGGYRITVDDTGERLNGLGVTIVLGSRHKLTAEVWTAMQETFNAGDSPPIWFDYLLDSYRNMAAGRLTFALVAAAIACETAIRGLFWATVSGVTHPTAVKIIDNVSVQQLLTRWADLTGMTKAELEIAGKSKVHALFDRRNEIMHYGASIDDSSGARDLILNARAFILDTDRRICSLTGSAYRPLGLDH